MFLAHRPSASDVARFLQRSRQLPLSYGEPGLLTRDSGSARFDEDEQRVVVGRGARDFVRAQAALLRWHHFDIGWTEIVPRDAIVEAGTVVAVQVHHLGFWSLNGARILYVVSGEPDESRFGFAYGTLTNHAENGEELFEVFLERESDAVVYRIHARSRPQATLARLGKPIVRGLQRRFRRDSAAAMLRAVSR